jgi:hypothetical protein
MSKKLPGPICYKYRTSCVKDFFSWYSLGRQASKKDSGRFFRLNISVAKHY